MSIVTSHGYMHLNLSYLNLSLRFQEIYLFIYGGSPFEVFRYLLLPRFTQGSFHLDRLALMMDCNRFINEICAIVGRGEAEEEETRQFVEWIRSLSEQMRGLDRVMASTRRLGMRSEEL